MTPEQIRALAKQAGGTPYTNRHYPGDTAVAFGPAALAEFVRLVREPVGYVPLSDSMIRKLQAEHPTENDPMAFARAVERAVRGDKT